MRVKEKEQTYTDQLLQSSSLVKTDVFTIQRESALNEFKKTGLPESKSEEYKFTPVVKMLAKHFDTNELYKVSPSIKSKVKDNLLDQFGGNRIVFINGRFSDSDSSFASGSAFTVQPLHEALKSYPEIILNKIGNLNSYKDPFALLNDAFWQDGLFIHVPKGVTIDEPLIVYHHHDASENKVASHTRLFIWVEEHASLNVIEKTNSTGSQVVFNSVNEEVIVDRNASFTYCKIQNDPGQLIQVSNTTIYQQHASRIDTFAFSLDGKLIRNNLTIIIDGEGCESHFYGLYLPNGDSLIDNHTVVDHKKPNSISNELYKGLMDDKAKGVFNGKIFVRPLAQKTNAFQSNRNILLSDTATINTKPQLEIWADDVKCSHGCTIGQLDEEAVFYLQSRGIPKSTAKAMLLYAFAGEVLEAVKDEKLRTYLDDMISERLHKNF